MKPRNNWIVIIIFNLLLYVISYFSTKTLLLTPEARTFPNLKFLLVLLLTILLVLSLGVAIRRYILTYLNDENERNNFRRILLFTAPLTLLLYMTLFLNYFQ